MGRTSVRSKALGTTGPTGMNSRFKLKGTAAVIGLPGRQERYHCRWGRMERVPLPGFTFQLT